MIPNADYPPAPWRLTGSAIVNLQLLSTEQARIPPGLTVAPVWPGRTLGGIYLARYGPGSTLEYSELIVFSGVARAGDRLGGWVATIYVDSEESAAGGREIWGLPKEMAMFDWDAKGVTVRQPDNLLIRVSGLECRRGFPIRAPLPAFGLKDERFLHFTGRCCAKVHRAKLDFHVPAESPFAQLGLGRGLSFELHDLEAIIPPPDPLGRRYS